MGYIRSVVIDHLQSTLNDNTAIAWIYCNYKEKSEQTLVNLFGNLLKQLILKRSSVPRHVRRLYEEHRKQNTRPAHSRIVKALQSEIESYSKTFIVVDALDKCPEGSGTRLGLLEGLRSLPGNVSLMVTSLELPGIKTESDTRLEIRATEEDVGRYVEGRIAQSIGCRDM